VRFFFSHNAHFRGAESLYVAPSIVPTHRTFEFKEKEEVDKYYPQYYHKIDKVRAMRSCSRLPKRKDSLILPVHTLILLGRSSGLH